MNINMTLEKDIDLGSIFNQLYPICRSITGPGIRESLEILAEHMPLHIEAVPSGSKVLDWTVPEEWELISARLIGPDGEVVVDTSHSNLHVLNFSEPFTGEMELDELQGHLYSVDELPNAIPYVTSYYVPRWGFCLSKEKRDTLQPGKYKVEINTKKYPGELNYAWAELQGESEEVVLVTSYLCHPSMANNELSGPLGLLRVYHELEKIKKRRFTYRFLLIPETIGSITYLAKNGEELSPKLFSGLVLTCLGGPGKRLSFKMSRRDWIGEPSPIDTLARHLADFQSDDFAVRDFTPTGGSDERQFCSPGFNLPMAQAARTIYGDYAAYHTSLDDLQFMTIEAVERSASLIAATLQAMECCSVRFRNKQPFGEPQLGRRNLYPSINGPMTNQFSTDIAKDGRRALDNLLCVLSLADGERTLLEIAEHIDRSVLELVPIVRHLEKESMMERMTEENK